MKIWILFLCAVVAAASAQSDESASDWDDDWKEYDDEWFKTRLAQLGIYNDEQNNSAEDGDTNVGVLERNQDEMDRKVEEDIKKFQEVEDEEEGDDKIDDYQFEDNRSEPSNEFTNDNKAEPIHDIEDGNNQDMKHLESENDYDDYALNLNDDDLSDNVLENEGMQIPEPQFSKNDDTGLLPFPESSEEIKRIMDETQAIINQEELKPNDFADNDEMSHENSDELKDIVEETNAIIEESLKPNDFAEDETINKNENLSALLEEPINDFAGDVLEEDDISNASQEMSNKQEKTDNLNHIEIPGNDSIEEENEDTVDKVYEDLNEDLDKLFETLDKLSKSDNDDEKPKPADVDYAVNSDESLDNKSDYDSIFDSNLSDIFAQHSEINENDDSKDTNGENNEEQIEAKESENDDEEQDMGEDIESEEKVLEDAPYINDALTSDDKNIKKPVKSVYVDELTDDQLENLRKDFVKQHSEVFDVESQSDDHVVNEVTLEYGETKVISSDNYPAGYPTNRVVDWIVIGKGQGIELNLTDFAVNSALGDYLMVKPGQIDDSGADGIIFSYHLNRPRAFRFTDVDRIFIRFDSKDGFSFLRGFSLTLKVIAPPAAAPEPEPEPERLLPEPQHTLTVMLGGLTLAQFQEVSEQFRLLVADMATMYINANGVEPGLNNTAEITQLVSASFCNVQWPGFEECSQVRFSVPLVYEDDDDDEHRLNETDLKTMWETYVDTDPFAARLRQMGIEEFSVPNDSGVLTVWLIVALGVVLSAAMLAIALWRYSCFENYTRMPAHSDTDSLYEKRSSALYPTPHQMLPPLYAEKDYDATRVDMGGYTNRSYTSTNMYDLDSDEDTVPRDRYTTDV